MKTISVIVTGTVLAAGLLAILLSQATFSEPADALPQSVQGRFFDMTVVTTDGKEFELPDKTVTCPLEFTASDGEGVYSCPAPHDISDLLTPAQVSRDPLTSSAVLVEIDAASLFWGFPANSWQIVQINYGESLSSANVLLGEELTNGETGHIENNVWPDFSRGVQPSSFHYKAKTNSSGYLGTEWMARGTQ
ncbi:MAG: hypothetical protein WD379_08865 [Dehalococcoidia bacterium]